MTVNIGTGHRSYARDGVVTPDGTKSKAYTSVTNLVSLLEDGWFFKQRDKAYALRGMVNALGDDGIRDSLIESITDSWGNDRALGKIADSLARDAGVWEKADQGTYVHHWTEMYDRGVSFTTFPSDVMPNIRAYAAKTAGIAWKYVEQQVVNDAYKYVGTLDRAGTFRGDSGARPFVGDVKAGHSAKQGLFKIACQLAAYANADLYDGTENRGAAEFDTLHGLLIWLPAFTDTCELIQLDLRDPWVAVEYAAALMGQRKAKTATASVEFTAISHESWYDRLTTATEVGQLHNIWLAAEQRGEWNEDLQSAAADRKAKLAAQANL